MTNSDIAHIPRPRTVFRVFIVDDSRQSCDILERQLKTIGHTVIGYHTSATWITNSVVQHAKSGPLLVMLDVDWPGQPEYGPYVAGIIKKRLEAVRIILCSARSEESLRALAMKCGADGWFRKDGETAALARVLDECAKKWAVATTMDI